MRFNVSVLISTLVLVVTASVAGTSVSAQVESHVIQSFDSQLEIQEDGTVDVQETIEYDFGSDQRHGIFREIPTLLQGDDGRYKIAVSDISVSDAFGEERPYEVNDTGESINIKIGDPDEKITGLQTYIIQYTLSGAMRYTDPIFDELYWNVTGDQWEVPITQTTATIRYPSTISVSDPALDAICFSGSHGSTAQGQCSIDTVQHGYSYQTRSQLDAGENMTISIALPKGSIAVLEPEKVISFWETEQGRFLQPILLTIAGILALGWYLVLPIWLWIHWLRFGRDPDIGPATTAWYDPPHGKNGRELTPAETGALIDETVEFRDISSMIFDLAQREYLHIREEKTDGFFGIGGKKTFSLIKMKEYQDDQTLQPFERTFLSAVFKGSKTAVRIDSLKLVSTIKRIKTQIYQSLMKEKFFPERPDRIRTRYYVLLGMAAATFNITLVLASWIFGRHMPRKTLRGTKQANIAKGLKNFLVSQERQLNFQGNEQMMFEKLLPYAIAFGVEKHWVQRFSSLNLQQPRWYEGSMADGFKTHAMLSMIGDSSAQLSSVGTPQSSSSSGFSGGFSGGGAGGGGGGAW